MLSILLISTAILAAQVASAPATDLKQQIEEHAAIVDGAVWRERDPVSGRMVVRTRIPVCWEGSGDFPREKRLVETAVREAWESASALEFGGWLQCVEKNAGIRIAVVDSKRGPHAKGLGHSLDGVRNGIVLNFSFKMWGHNCQDEKVRDLCIKAIAVHEFGHGIGLTHEQNRFDTPGECMYLAKGKRPDRLLTPWDQSSVMNYCNPDWGNHGKLSRYDQIGVEKVYGKRHP